MAILKFTAKDKLASAVMPDGYYSFEVVEVGEPVKSGSGKSFNIRSTFRVIEDPTFAGKELKITFNTGMDAASVMGTMYLMPHTAIPHLAAAIGNIPIGEVSDELETTAIKGKFDARVHKTISDGVVLNTVSGFLPYGEGKSKEKEVSPF